MERYATIKRGLNARNEIDKSLVLDIVERQTILSKAQLGQSIAPPGFIKG